jgi:cupin 2 domain-containing protein
MKETSAALSPSGGNLFAALPATRVSEDFTGLLERPGLRIERIVSHGQSTPAGAWYDQSWDEWVLVVAGGAEVQIEGEATVRVLGPGDYLFLPAGCRHRVAWTDPLRETIWLAIHVGVPCTGDA